MSLSTIAHHWNELEAANLQGVSDTQRRECRRMFHAGFRASLHIFIAVIADESMSEESGIQMIDRLLAESAAFMNDMREGKA